MTGRIRKVERTIEKKEGQRQSGNERVIYMGDESGQKSTPITLAVSSAACQASCHTIINNAVPVQ